jgi:hypothetical protein
VQVTLGSLVAGQPGLSVMAGPHDAVSRLFGGAPQLQQS